MEILLRKRGRTLQTPLVPSICRLVAGGRASGAHSGRSSRHGGLEGRSLRSVRSDRLKPLKGLTGRPNTMLEHYDVLQHVGPSR